MIFENSLGDWFLGAPRKLQEGRGGYKSNQPNNQRIGTLNSTL
jgi:hypothetical protein